jgi:ketopantoate reductase
MGVTVLARGKRLAEIQSNGIVIENPCHNQATNAEASAERGVSTTCP